MIPTPEELAPIAARNEGALAELPFATVLHAHALARRTATLEIQRGQAWKKVILEQGVPIDCRSNLAHETLSRYMVGVGLLKPEDEGRYLGEAVARGVRFGEVLLERGVLNAVELERVLQQNLAKKLLDPFSWRDGRFLLHAEVPTPDSPLKVNVPQLILLGINKLVAQPDVDREVATLIGKPLGRHPSPPHRLEDLTLPAAHRQVLDALSSPRRLDELALATKLAAEDLSRAVYALAVVGFLGQVDRLPKAAPAPVAPARPPQPPTSTAAPPPMRAPAEGEIERIGNEITMLFLVHRRLDSFDLLGVAEDASTTAIAEAYVAFSQRFAPWPLSGALADKSRALFFAGARAFAELGDPATKAALIERRQAKQRTASTPKSAADEAIKTDLLDPEVQFKKGQAMLAAGKLGDALTQLEYAFDLDPQNALYRAELAWCRFKRDPLGSAERAISELKDALRVDASNGPALYYAGEVYRHLGNREAARIFLERAIKPMAPDRRPIDALRALLSQPS